MDGVQLLRSRRGLMAQVAIGLGISHWAVNKWRRVPAERVLDVERITGIPKEQLRPDLYRESSVTRHHESVAISA